MKEVKATSAQTEKPSPRGFKLKLPKGEVRGVATIRDKHGNFKGTLILGEGPPIGHELNKSETEVK